MIISRRKSFMGAVASIFATTIPYKPSTNEVITVPGIWTPEQIRQFQTYWEKTVKYDTNGNWKWVA